MQPQGREAEPPTGLHLTPETAGDGGVLERLLSNVTCTVVQAGWYSFPPEWSLPRRLTPNYIVFVGVDGEAEVTIGEQPHRLSSGIVLLTPPHVPQHARNTRSEPVCFYTIHCVARLYGVLDMPAIYGLPTALRPSPARMAQATGAARRIVRELAAREAGCALAANGDCARLLALLWREAVSIAGTAPPSDVARAAEVARLAPVFRMIEAHHPEPLTLKQLADVVHLDPAYFCTLFKKTTGLPPVQYLARYRLQQVRNRLLSTDESISEIAAATGYRGPAYLSRVFHRVEGISPSEFRRSKKSPSLP